jgi:hypothetical protein
MSFEVAYPLSLGEDKDTAPIMEDGDFDIS